MSASSITPEIVLERESSRRRHRLSKVTVIAAVVLGAILLLTVFGYVVAPQDPKKINLDDSSLGPYGAHLLGTDQLGRDILSRVLAGARTAVLGPLLIAVVVTTLATLLGLVAGYIGGWSDAVISRVGDVVYSLPPLLVAIVVVGVLGGGYFLGIIVLIVLGLPMSIRSKRAASLEQRALPYIEAARVLGIPRRQIMLRHVLPNFVPVILASFFLNFTYGFVDLSTLSFLGLGVDPGTPDWGRMIAESRVLIFDNPAAALAPLLMIVVTAVSANLVGEAIAEHVALKGRSR